MDYKQIVWLASYPKSGNTWVRTFLDAYYLGSVDINELVCSVSDDREDRFLLGDGSEPHTYPVDIQHIIKGMSLVRLVRAFEENKFASLPLFVKTHDANMLPNGSEMLPVSLTKATVFIMRDPRDVVISFAKHMGTDIDTAIEWMADPYRTLVSNPGRMSDFLSSWDKHTNSFINADAHNVKVFRYEDMRQEPVNAFADIMRHAGVTPIMERVEQAVDLVKLSNIRKQEQEKGFIESSPHAKNQFFGKGKVGGWQSVLTQRQQYKIERKFGRVMKRMGYLDKRKAA